MRDRLPAVLALLALAAGLLSPPPEAAAAWTVAGGAGEATVHLSTPPAG